ncbi:MAG: glycosyltransferase [Cyclobacteriaceae bacterium]
MKKTTIVFILSSISQPRCLKRIRSFINAGYEVEIYGFDRGVYNINAKIDGKKIEVLGFAPSGYNYFKKFIHTKKQLKIVFNKYDNKNVVYYLFGFDQALICKLFSKNRYIYEISDLVYTYFKYPGIRFIFKTIDKFIINNSLLTVLITKGFKKYFNLKTNHIIIQPNKLDSYFNHQTRTTRLLKPNQSIAFGFAGAIRYQNTIFRFAKIIGEHFPQHSFYFFGDTPNKNNVIDFSNQFSNVYYMGPFKNPEDLQEVYEKIDVVVACYRTDTINERVAEPNKLYEALYFNKPIIVSKGTYMENFVTIQNDFGYAINATVDAEIKKLIENIEIEKLNEKIKNISTIPPSNIIDDNGSRILSFLENRLNKHWH